jgi:Ca2+/H+ antiporter
MGYPENSGYMVAAYTVAAVVVLVYSVTLYFRVRRYRDR